MTHKDLNYSLHYSKWHNEETRKSDIAYYSEYLKRHNLFPNRTDSRILEIGCGMGNLLLALKSKDFSDLKGIDIDFSQVESCQSQGLDVIQADIIEFLSTNDTQYDAVYFFDVLEHLPKEQQIDVLKKINSHMSHNGKLVLTVPNALAPLGHYFQHIDWTHYNAFSDISLDFLLKNAGFEYITFRPTHLESLSIRWLKRHWIRLYKKEFNITNPILTPSLMAVCFKNKVDLENYLRDTDSLMDYRMSSMIKRIIKRLLKLN